eukprot:gene22708-biopygen14800
MQSPQATAEAAWQQQRRQRGRRCVPSFPHLFTPAAPAAPHYFLQYPLYFSYSSAVAAPAAPHCSNFTLPLTQARHIFLRDAKKTRARQDFFTRRQDFSESARDFFIAPQRHFFRDALL